MSKISQKLNSSITILCYILSLILIVNFTGELKSVSGSIFYTPSTFINLRDKFKAICLDTGLSSEECNHRVAWLSEQFHRNLDLQAIVLAGSCDELFAKYIHSLSGNPTGSQRRALHDKFSEYCSTAIEYSGGSDPSKNALFGVGHDTSFEYLIMTLTDDCHSIISPGERCILGKDWFKNQQVRLFKSPIIFSQNCDDLMKGFATLEHESSPNTALLSALSDWGACYTLMEEG